MLLRPFWIASCCYLSISLSNAPPFFMDRGGRSYPVNPGNGSFFDLLGYYLTSSSLDYTSSLILTACTISSSFLTTSTCSTSLTEFYLTMVTICSSSILTSSIFFTRSSSSLRLASMTIWRSFSSSSYSCFLISSACIEACKAASKSACSSLKNSGSTSFCLATA